MGELIKLIFQYVKCLLWLDQAVGFSSLLARKVMKIAKKIARLIKACKQRAGETFHFL